MSYRTKRPATRSLLVFGVGMTLAITQLGAGCVPASPSPRDVCGSDAASDGAGEECGDASNERGDAK